MAASANRQDQGERSARRRLSDTASARNGTGQGTSLRAQTPSGASSEDGLWQARWLLGWALVGMEAFLCVLAAAIPLGGVSLSISPLTRWWPWLLAPARLIFGNALVDASVPPAAGWTALALVAVALVGASCVLALVAWRLHGMEAILCPNRRVLALVLGGALVLGVTMLLLPVLPSDDIFSYILYGRISVVHHANPLITVPGAFPSDPFLTLVYWRDTRSVYGAVWLLLSGGVVQLGHALGNTLPVYVLLFKGVGLLAHLGNAALIWAILGVLAPRRQVVGTLLYAWNPLCLLEFCASGHNDAVMLFFLLLAIYLLARGWDLAAMGALGLSIATKYMPIILVPFYLVLVWRTLAGRGASQERRLLALAWRCGALALVLLVTVLPYWAGPQTLGSLLYSPPAQNLDNSMADTVGWPVSWLIQGLFHLDLTAARHEAEVILKVIILGAYGVLWLALLPRARTLLSMLETWGWALVGYAVIASGWFWPWYVTWVVAIVALLPWRRLTSGALVLAASVLTLYGFLPLQSSPLFGYRSGLEFLPAIVVFLWPWLRRRWARRVGRGAISKVGTRSVGGGVATPGIAAAGAEGELAAGLTEGMDGVPEHGR